VFPCDPPFVKRGGDFEYLAVAVKHGCAPVSLDDGLRECVRDGRQPELRTSNNYVCWQIARRLPAPRPCIESGRTSSKGAYRVGGGDLPRASCRVRAEGHEGTR
jgi:hypothetical protein